MRQSDKKSALITIRAMRLFNHTNFDIILSTSTIFSIFVVIVLSDWSLLTPSFMTDIKTPEERSRNMSAIKSNDTKPEMSVRRYLHGLGYRYGLHNKKLPGRPDIVLRRYKTIIFVNGCFWHGHENCKYYRLPKSNTDFWQTKIAQNRAPYSQLASAKLSICRKKTLLGE